MKDDWTGFVDESGTFGNDEVSVVTMLLTDPMERRVLDTSFRAVLETHAGHVQWPPHATEVRTDFMHVAWLLTQREEWRQRGLGPSSDQAHAEHALHLLRCATPDGDGRAAMDNVLRGSRPDVAKLRDVWARSTLGVRSDAIRRITSIRKHTTALFESAICSVLKRGGVRWIAAVAPSAVSVPGEDRYLAGLAELFDRVYVGDPVGASRPRLRVQTRRVRECALDQMVTLSSRHIQDANRIVRERRGALRGEPCHFRIEQMIPFRESAEGGDVAVDWISGRAFWACRHASGVEAAFAGRPEWLPQGRFRVPAPAPESAPAGLAVVHDEAGRAELTAYVVKLLEGRGGAP